MAVDETGEEQKKTPSRVSVPPTAQALSSVQIEAAPEEHPIFRMPLHWGKNLGRAEVKV